MAAPSDESSPQLASLLEVFPRGELSEIVGPWSSGGRSLLAALLARATAAGDLAALVDGEDLFDPAVLAAARGDCSRLLWIRCGGRLLLAGRATELLARSSGFGVVALDVGTPGTRPRRSLPPAAGLRLRRAVEGTPTVLVLRVPRRLVESRAALVLSVERVRACWVGAPRPTRLAGLLSRVQVLHARGIPGLVPGRAWTIDWPL